jgi:hypothetical protein
VLFRQKNNNLQQDNNFSSEIVYDLGMSEASTPVEGKISALQSAEVRPWHVTAELMDEVERSAHWQLEAPSFSKWITKFAKELKLSEASLWRFRTGYRILQEIRTEVTKLGTDCPEIAVLAQRCNPQNLELFDKLKRVLSGPEIELLQLRVLNGSVTRDELRHLWQIYRPALGGKTARGHGTEVPVVENYRLLTQLHLEATVLASVVSTKDWLGEQTVHCRSFSKVLLLNGNGKLPSSHLDVAVLTRNLEQDDDLTIHGIEIFERMHTPEALLERYSEKNEYCHYFWFAGDSRAITYGHEAAIPPGAGLLWCQNGGIKVIRQAKRTQSSQIGVTAMALLKMTVKR